MATDRGLTPTRGPTRRLRRFLFVVVAASLIAAAAVVAVGWTLVRPHRTEVGASPADLAATTVHIATRDGRSLAGWFVKGDAGAGALLLMHGIRSDRREMVDDARMLARERFTLLLFDFRAEGESDGSRVSAGFFESEDARAAVEFLRREAPGEKVGAIGRSMGGAAALLGDGPLALDALVLESVYPDIEQAIGARMRFDLGSFGPPFAPLLLCQLRPWLGIGPERMRPVDAVARLHAPLLVMSGDHDRFLPVDEARRVFAAAPEPKEFWIVPGADHESLRRVQPEQYDRHVVPFLIRSLRNADHHRLDLQRFLDELVDRRAPARLPEFPYVTKQASSYDRRSTSPQDATENGWFANTDNMDGAGADLKWVKHGGRDECVLVDVDGPGVLTRLWLGGKKAEGKIRFYVDAGAPDRRDDEPALAEVAEQLLSGEGAIPSPLAIRTAGDALNLYLPIPFAKHLQITYDEGIPGKPPPQRWFNAEYRIYDSTVDVQSFSAAEFAQRSEAIAATARRLAEPDDMVGSLVGGTGDTLVPNAKITLAFSDGPKAIDSLALTLLADAPFSLRPLILIATFDDEPAVWCPVSEFFGCGDRLVDFHDWRRTVRAGHSTLMARFPMPYARRAKVELVNFGERPVTASLSLRGGACAWDERSLHFHATWHADHHLKTRPFSAFNFVNVQGAGVYAGDTLSVWNPVRDWWGEGDEKIFVDGEAFPSHFGTGTEDHYGFAWGAPTRFETPFGGQPRVDGRGNLGATTVTRSRLLDVVPFTKSLQYELEVWHWADCEVAYSAAAFWYARPGATCNRTPQEAQAREPVAVLDRPGRFEAEELKLRAHSDGLPIETQTGVVFPSGRWSLDAQRFVKGREIGDYVELEIPPPSEAFTRLRIDLTRSWDYGVLRLALDGVALGVDFDAYDEKGSLTSVELGPIETSDDARRPSDAAAPRVLRIEVVGKNPRATGSGCYFGIDAVEWER